MIPTEPDIRLAELESQIERIQNAMESAVDDAIKVSLIRRVLDGH